MCVLSNDEKKIVDSCKRKYKTLLLAYWFSIFIWGGLLAFFLMLVFKGWNFLFTAPPTIIVNGVVSKYNLYLLLITFAILWSLQGLISAFSSKRYIRKIKILINIIDRK